MPRGGKRPNSGPKKGAVYKPTLAKAEAREALRAVVMEHMADLLSAQIKHAKGLSYLVARHKASGKFEKLTAEEAERILKGEESDRMVIEVWEKDPSVQAFTDLMNRALDKPSEHMELEHSGDITIRHEALE
jgi:hypothetical protein